MNAITFRPSKAMGSIAAWIRRTLAADVPITRAQMEAWALGIEHAGARYKELEDRLDAASDPVAAAVVSIALAEAAYDRALVRIARLATLAQDAATVAELAEIDRDASDLIDTLEILTRGVRRPADDTSEKQGA